MDTFGEYLKNVHRRAEAIRNDAGLAAEGALPGGVFFLGDNEILAFPRDDGDSRYPYGRDGFNFWAYASGYMHCNEGLFSIFLRASEGQEPGIAFFAGIPMQDFGSRRLQPAQITDSVAAGFSLRKYTPVPILPVPMISNAGGDEFRRYTILSPTSACYITESGSLRFALRVFVTEKKDICFSLNAANLSESDQKIFLSTFLNPFLRHQIYESGEDRWFKEIKIVNPAGEHELGDFLVTVNEDVDRETSVKHYGVIRRRVSCSKGSRLVCHEETTSRYQYVGSSRGSLHTPGSLVRGTFGEGKNICAFTETAVAGDLLHMELAKGGGEVRVVVVISCTDDRAKADSLLGRPVDPALIDDELSGLKDMDRVRHAGLEAQIISINDDRLKPTLFNNFFEHLKRQVEFCALMKGYAQLSENSLIGIRDVFQAIEALVFWQPQAGRGKMLEALEYMTPNGRCFRQYSLPSTAGEVGRVDIRPFIDQGAWVLSCVATYMRLTGDASFLDEVCGYHEIVDEQKSEVRRASKRGSVAEHLIKIMDYLLAHRDTDQTGCVRAMYGDWNDALDGLGVSQDPLAPYGTGVSVMATLQVYQNALEMAGLLKWADAAKHRKKIKAYEKAAGELKKALEEFAVIDNGHGEKKILHGWGGGRNYMVGSFKDPDGRARDGLTSNAFWVLSGMYEHDTAMRPTLLAAFERLDSKYGFKTFEPFFPEDTKGVGRIVRLPPGTAENGATYVHATVFGIMALFKMGCPREAWHQLLKILPFTDIHKTFSHSPFVMPNSYGYNEEKGIDGESMNDWQTGSSNVVLKLIIRYVFGFEPEMDGAWIQPASWMPLDSFEFKIRVRGGDVRIRYECRGKVAAGFSLRDRNRTFSINGVAAEGTRDRIMNLSKLWVPWETLAQASTEIVVID